MFGVKCNRNLMKYELIVEELKEAIRQKKLVHGDAVPSISKVSKAYSCARETVVKSFKILKEEGIIESRPSKGFYIASENVEYVPHIFLLLNSLNPYMEVLYNAFLAELEGKAVVDIFFHNNNIEVFRQLITENSTRYYSYVVKPIDHPDVEDILTKLPQDDLLILDRREGINDERSYICQRFDSDLYASLESSMPALEKYSKINMFYSDSSFHPKLSLQSFQSFCTDKNIDSNIIADSADFVAAKNEVYITIEDNDLVKILKSCKKQNLQVGSDVGIISYNDTPMKEFVANGITTISADFELMGCHAAQFACTKQKVQTFESARLKQRNSL